MSGGVEGWFKGRVGGLALDLSFRLAPGRVTALSGASGAGKTTLVRCIAGLSRLAGRLVVDGEVWQDDGRFLAPHRRAVGVVFQEPSLLTHLAVRGNLEFGARRAKGRWVVSFDEVVELLGLSRLVDRGVANLSGGERQRVALGRALLSQPRLLLLDEPLSSLDATAKAEILPYLQRVHRALDLPMLYVSHDAAELAALADEVLVLRDGRIAAGADDYMAARARLGMLDVDEKERLALAAILAGLPPAD